MLSHYYSFFLLVVTRKDFSKILMNHSAYKKKQHGFNRWRQIMNINNQPRGNLRGHTQAPPNNNTHAASGEESGTPTSYPFFCCISYDFFRGLVCVSPFVPNRDSVNSLVTEEGCNELIHELTAKEGGAVHRLGEVAKKFGAMIENHEMPQLTRSEFVSHLSSLCEGIPGYEGIVGADLNSCADVYLAGPERVEAGAATDTLTHLARFAAGEVNLTGKTVPVGGGLKVLLVDDSSITLKMGKMLFEKGIVIEGKRCSLETVSTGAFITGMTPEQVRTEFSNDSDLSGFAKLTEITKENLLSTGVPGMSNDQLQGFGMILMDIEMPGRDGITTTNYLRSELGDDCPIIIKESSIGITQEEVSEGLFDGSLETKFSVKLFRAIAPKFVVPN
ncbi:hypothetical protein DID80_05100 [Candidatus Marinamargulisbacteria bacterium SCGC AAA071-K20]|nr:hypothetical protein DID80_05100 [Candidatus Marinamargulisbacteria bacterium SCGC AAA071-K20]